MDFFYFFELGLKNSVTWNIRVPISWNIRKASSFFFWENKKNFSKWIFFYLSSLKLKVAQVAPYYTTVWIVSDIANAEIIATIALVWFIAIILLLRLFLILLLMHSFLLLLLLISFLTMRLSTWLLSLCYWVDFYIQLRNCN